VSFSLKKYYPVLDRPGSGQYTMGSGVALCALSESNTVSTGVFLFSGKNN